ncbi:MAG: F0F1 ATP synthase subunit A [Desulfobacteraceae bacterium]|nr:F0F1 ATP synthase subunit A [Desulfobacteraceae bacterium]
MNLKDITPDQVVFWQWRFVTINATILFTWLVMALLVGASWLITRRFGADTRVSRWQNLVEVLVDGMRGQIRDISQQESRSHLVFVGTLFIFILTCNLLQVFPGYVAPTASLSTTAALAICVFISVPLYGISSRGVGGFFKQYLRPTWLMLPFNVLGELSRTLALAVRLFGNIMSGTKVAAILLSLAPLFFPVVMHALGLLTGVIQAYIFSVLAMVYIASATRAQAEVREKQSDDARQPEP